MKKLLLIFLTFILIPTLHADEGMWLVNLLEQNLKNKMRSYGFRLDFKEIYNENNPALHDAVVALDFGCTGSMISNEGLLITNHHCAYDDIHRYSTPENNYLEKGFWAKNRSEEIPIAGKFVFFLRRVIDVTDEINAYLDSCRNAGTPVTSVGMRRVAALFERKYSEGTDYQVRLHNMYRGVYWYVFFYEQFEDVRLVGAPPSSIGAFGGAADNFKWPQHRGDFALYRVYGDKDGRPAKYSPDNVPIKPRRVLTISEKGVKENDFAMTLGYPASTIRYMPSAGVNERIEALNPPQHHVRGAILNAMRPWMDSDTTIRFKYAARYFSIANMHEARTGEWVNLLRFNVLSEKQAEETEMQKWIESDPKRRSEYGNLLADIEKAYSSTLELNKAKTYFQESIIRGSIFLQTTNRYRTLMTNMERRATLDTVLTLESDIVQQMVRFTTDIYDKLYDERIERDVLAVVIRFYIQRVPQQFWDPQSVEILTKFNGNPRAIADYIFDNSIFRNKETFLDAFSGPFEVMRYANDPAVLVNRSASILPFNNVERRLLGGLEPSELRTTYARTLYEFRRSQNQLQSPDANNTMRMSYGRVGGINPSDGVYGAAQTTYQGYFDKINPTNYEFKFCPRLRELFERKEFGRWGENGVLYVNFLTDNDMTAGNSGSPVLNADGHLIGLAYDGNWEALAGDIYYKEGYNKAICVDIRYVMWVIEKYAGAGYLLNEMTFAR